jgi:Ca-activated chloride channel family protein
MHEAFHFIRPWWLLALLPLALLAWRAVAAGGRENAWRNVVDARLMPLLQVGRAGAASRQVPWLLASGWLIATVALADPTWERRPQPVFQTQAARVVVLDLSDSMNATDLTPSRLVRARYKIEDVLSRATQGQTGLVAYAGDAFTVSPLTRDTRTISSLLKVLEPALMPTQGDRADLGLAKAGELLLQAGMTNGQVLLIADGVDATHAAAAERAAAKLSAEGYTVSVLGIGTDTGAPVLAERDQAVHDASGNIPISRLDAPSLESIARSGGGAYRTMSDDGAALHALLAAGPSTQRVGKTPAAATASAWQEQGPLIVLLLLPLAALAFRRNWLVGLSLAAALAGSPQAAGAATWRDAWQRPDQQAAQALAAGDFAKAVAAAAGTADPALRGSAEYKTGDYQRASDDFAHASGADADYNRGNALARLGRYPDAIAAYDKSIGERSANDDARANKAAVEALMKQQPAPKQGNGSSKGGEGQKQQGNSKGQSGEQGKGQGSGSASSGGQQGEAAESPSQAKGQGQGQGQSAGGRDDASASASRQGASASANGDQGQQASARTGQAGQQPEGNAAPSPSQAPVDQFAQAVKKLGATDREDKVGLGPATNATPDAARSDRGDSTQAGSDPSARSSGGDAQPLESEERLAAEQWLRRIPDDPGGLLKRKFLYQYRQRQQQGAPDAQ